MNFKVAFNLAQQTASTLGSVSARHQQSRNDEAVIAQLKRNRMLNGTSHSSISQPNEAIGEVDFSSSKYGIKQSMALSQTEKKRFIAGNKDLLSIIDQSDEAKDLLRKKEITKRSDLEEVVAQSAHDLLNTDTKNIITEDYLKKNINIASLLVLDVGGLRTRVNEDAHAASYFTNDLGAGENVTYRQVAQKAADLFKENTPLNDEEFFFKNPNAAVYVLENGAQRKRFTNYEDSNTEAARFKASIDSEVTQRTLNSYVASYTAEKVKSGPYSASFFEGAPRFAEFVAAGEHLDNMPKASSYLRENPQFLLNNFITRDNFNFTTIVNNIVGHQARSFLDSDSPLTQEHLSRMGGLSQFILEDENIRKNLNAQDAKDQLKLIFSDTAKANEISSDIESAINQNYHSTFSDIKPTYKTVQS